MGLVLGRALFCLLALGVLDFFLLLGVRLAYGKAWAGKLGDGFGIVTRKEPR